MQIISLFSGAGGLDLGLKLAGHDIVWANDIFQDAAKTYYNNICAHVDIRDIKVIPSSEIPDGNVVVGGFPCQGFSVANWGRTTDDPRNQLYQEMVRVIRDKRPQFFIAENVKGLVSLGKGEILRKILNTFENVGYRVQYQIVNAADYGVPQMRMRLLIIGVRQDLPNILEFPPLQTHANPKNAHVMGKIPWLTVGEALRHFPEPNEKCSIPNHDNSKYKLRFNGHIGHRYVYADRPAPTVTARGDDRGGVVVLHHPGNHRRMTVRELAAVQSFPDWFIFSGSKTSAYRQIANAVPPMLGKAIGLMLTKTESNTIDNRILTK